VAVCSGFGDQKISYRDEDVWNGRMVSAGTGRTTELGHALRTTVPGRALRKAVAGRAWRTATPGHALRTAVAGRAWRTAVAGRSSRSTVGRKWVDGEREGKIWGEALN
jgi:hypothetical protein